MKPKTALTTAYYVAFVALGLSTAILGPALPELAENTRTTLGQIGFLFTARSFGYLLGSLFGGRTFDRLPGNRILASVLLGMSVMWFFVPLSGQLWLLTALLLALGLGEGTLDVGANLLLVWVHRERANPFLNALHFFFGVGAFIAPVLFAQSLLLTGDIKWSIWGLALYPIPVAIWLLRLPSPQVPHDSLKSLEAPVPWLPVILISLVFFLYVGAEIAFGGWIYSYATALGLSSAAGAAYLTSVFWLALTAGRLLGIPIAARLRPERILYADWVICLAAMAVILSSQGATQVWIGSIALGLGMASIFPTLLAYSERHMTMTGRVTRWFFVGTGAGGMLLPWLAGGLFERLGPEAVMWAILLDLALGLAVFALVDRIGHLQSKNPSPGL